MTSSQLPHVQSQAKGDADVHKTTPVHVYGPEGLCDFINSALMISDTFIGMPIVVFELVPGAVPAAETEISCVNTRSKLYQVRAST